VDQVEKIIERDFFPELEKLKAQADYFDARERKDYATMSRLQVIRLQNRIEYFIFPSLPLASPHFLARFLPYSPSKYNSS
jgi:hypothetical protein